MNDVDWDGPDWGGPGDDLTPRGPSKLAGTITLAGPDPEAATRVIGAGAVVGVALAPGPDPYAATALLLATERWGVATLSGPDPDASTCVG